MRVLITVAVAALVAGALLRPVAAQAGAYEEAYRAALRILRGVSPADCNARAPEGTVCVERYSDLTARRSAELGVARFSITFVSSPGSYVAFFGRMTSGTWEYWFGAQDRGSPLVQLPSDLLACTGVGGAAAQVQAAGAGQAQIVPPLTRLRAEAFVLTAPGTPSTLGTPDRPGNGWYLISSPVAGWVPERDVTDAANGDCAAHDARYR